MSLQPNRFQPDHVSRAQLRPVGSIDLLDLKVLAEFYGRDFLPFPFMRTAPVPFQTEDQVSAHAAEVMEQFNLGDLTMFVEYMSTYAAADIRVEFHVQYIPHYTPSVRVMTHRTGPLGFFSQQQADADIVDVYALSPYDLGAAIRDAVPVTQPGRHAAIVVPDYAPSPQSVFDTDDFVVRHTVDLPSEVIIPAAEVSAYATVQSHWRPRRKWGRDRSKEAVVWIRVQDDGEYIYEPDMSWARPMTKTVLHKRVERLIAQDAAIVRELRRR